MSPTPMVADAAHHRWWTWDGHEVDLLGTGWDPPVVLAAILAHRDGDTAEDEDVATYLTWSVEAHPPWVGGCPSCGSSARCTEQVTAERVAYEWLTAKAIERIRRIHVRASKLERPPP